jgi:hypothetical protein
LFASIVVATREGGIIMSVIFQLFCAEDLKKLTHDQLVCLREKIKETLEDLKGPDNMPLLRRSPLALSLRVSDKFEPDSNMPQQIKEQVDTALNKRFDEVSHQLMSPQLNQPPPTFNIDDRINQRKTLSDEDKMILEWAIACEVNNFEFYYPLLQAKEAAYAYFKEATTSPTAPKGLSPRGPDSLYSPFNPRHPLSSLSLFYRLLQQESASTPSPPPATP